MDAMSGADFGAASWPGEAQRWLLQACVLPGPEGVAAWERWRGRVRLEDVDHASMRLLPMLHHALVQAGVSDPDLGRYRGVYRNSWYRNQLLFSRLVAVIGELREAGVTVRLLKGAALAQLFYPESGRRPMSDGDLLVPEAQAETAIAVLRRGGWNSSDGYGPEGLRRRLAVAPGVNFENAEHIGIDLHWRVSDWDPELGRDEDNGAGSGARPTVTLQGLAVETLWPTEHLWHTLVHGMPWNPVPSFRWVVDAMMILRAGERGGPAGAVDWAWLVRRAKQRELTAIAGHALEYLRRYFAASVPAGVMAELAAARVARWERNEFRAMTSSNLTLWRVSNLWYRYRRLRRAVPAWRDLGWWEAYPRYLCGCWGLERAREIPREVWRRGWGQVRGAVGRARAA